jgi:hypothetical protein
VFGRDLRLTYVPAWAQDSCGDLPEAEQKLVWAAMAPAADVFSKPYPGAAWKTKPCWYVVASEDHTVNPDLERFIANRMNAKTTEIVSSHVPCFPTRK